MLLFP